MAKPKSTAKPKPKRTGEENRAIFSKGIVAYNEYKKKTPNGEKQLRFFIKAAFANAR